MRHRIGLYRREPIRAEDDPEIGCLFIRDAVFFNADRTADPPPEFAPSVVVLDTYHRRCAITGAKFGQYSRRRRLRPVRRDDR